MFYSRVLEFPSLGWIVDYIYEHKNWFGLNDFHVPEYYFEEIEKKSNNWDEKAALIVAPYMSIVRS